MEGGPWRERFCFSTSQPPFSISKMDQRSRRSQSRKSPLRRLNRKRITPAEARRRAADHVLNRMFKGAKVADGAKAQLCLGYNPGPSPKWSIKDSWVVYQNLEEPLSLKSSSVILVCKRTGRVLYEGSAGDEG